MLFTVVILALGAVTSPLGAGGVDPAAPAAAPNLIRNGGFENGAAGWLGCGDVLILDAKRLGQAAVAGGRYSARLGNPALGLDCPEPPGFEDQITQVLLQEVTVPASASALTLSFWYSVLGDPHATLEVIVAPELYFPSPMAYIQGYGNPGWQLFREQLQPFYMGHVRGKQALVAFRLTTRLTTNQARTFIIDDVSLVPAAIQTQPTRLPAALRGDGTRPIALIHGDGPAADPFFETHLWRMDSDGTNRELVYEGQLEDLFDPTWSWDGTQLAVIDANTYPPGETNSNNYVSATALTLVDPETGDSRVLYQTRGTPGRFPCVPQPAECPDFIQKLTELSWAPDDGVLAGGIFAFQQNEDYSLEGGLARIEAIDAQTGKSLRLALFGTEPSWGRGNRILFEAYDLQGDGRELGIWEIDLSRRTAKTRLLFRGDSTANDGDPVWAPDGRRFVTIRWTAGERQIPGDDPAETQALMLFERGRLDLGRMILLADHGFIQDPAWSPDGRYLIYTLRTPRGENIWWVDVRTGATGPITKDNRSRDAHWRPS